MWDKKKWIKKKAIVLYDGVWRIGEFSGCHQMPERSFYCFKKQFPVCARCTGAFIGYILGLLIYPFIKIPIWLDILFCAIMFADWFVQYKKWIPSNNIRRLITGLVCGFGLMQIYVEILICFIKII